MPFDPATDDPEVRWAYMRKMERAGQLRLPLPGVAEPTEEEYEEAFWIRYNHEHQGLL